MGDVVLRGKPGMVMHPSTLNPEPCTSCKQEGGGEVLEVGNVVLRGKPGMVMHPSTLNPEPCTSCKQEGGGEVLEVGSAVLRGKPGMVMHPSTLNPEPCTSCKQEGGAEVLEVGSAVLRGKPGMVMHPSTLNPEPCTSCKQEGGAEVLEVGNVVLRGKPGMVTLHLVDGSGAGGASALAPDTLELNLAPGPMAVRTTPAPCATLLLHPIRSALGYGVTRTLMFFQPGARAHGGAHHAWLQHNPFLRTLSSPSRSMASRSRPTPWSSTWRPGPWRCVTILLTLLHPLLSTGYPQITEPYQPGARAHGGAHHAQILRDLPAHPGNLIRLGYT